MVIVGRGWGLHVWNGYGGSGWRNLSRERAVGFIWLYCRNFHESAVAISLVVCFHTQNLSCCPKLLGGVQRLCILPSPLWKSENLFKKLFSSSKGRKMNTKVGLHTTHQPEVQKMRARGHLYPGTLDIILRVFTFFANYVVCALAQNQLLGHCHQPTTTNF